MSSTDKTNFPRLKPGWLGGRTTLYISSPFGPRKKPSPNASSYHRGIDIAVPVGTPIYAPMSGLLKCTSLDKRGGGLIYVLRSGSLELRFMHLLDSSSLGDSVGKTMNVVEGQLIAKTGGAKGNRTAGCSTGPHLHFEYRWNSANRWTSDDALDPVNFLSDRLIGRVHNHLISKGMLRIPKQKSKASKKVEYVDYKVGDGNPMEYVEYSFGELEERAKGNVAFETDDDATEYYQDDVPDDDYYTGTEKYANGVWQIVKLAMDSSVTDLLLYDASVSIQTGAVLGFFNKACQQPLVEFSGDMYGDQYFFIVRKPPFDKKNMLKALDSQDIFNTRLDSLQKSLEDLRSANKWDFKQDWNENIRRINEYKRVHGYDDKYYIELEKLENEIKKQEIYRDVYSISDNEIINSSIGFKNDGIYSWYQFYPQYECSSDEYQYIVPAVMFPEYAAIWGSRALQIQSQYASFKGMGVRDKTKNDIRSEAGDKRCRTILDDLKYLIECNAYAPFVRQGTITLKGTRRIKRGMFIQVQIENGVDEVFYVENVSQNFTMTNNTVQRTTTLQLSHGMVKQYIRDVDKSQTGVGISYFNIIDFVDYDEKRSLVNIGNWRECISKWKVNLSVFKFFLKRQQFVLSNSIVE